MRQKAKKNVLRQFETVRGQQSLAYLLMAEVPDFRTLGSLSEPGIFHGPGETVAFRTVVLVLRVLMVWRWPFLGNSLGFPSGSLWLWSISIPGEPQRLLLYVLVAPVSSLTWSDAADDFLSLVSVDLWSSFLLRDPPLLLSGFLSLPNCSSLVPAHAGSLAPASIIMLCPTTLLSEVGLPPSVVLLLPSEYPFQEASSCFDLSTFLGLADLSLCSPNLFFLWPFTESSFGFLTSCSLLISHVGSGLIWWEGSEGGAMCDEDNGEIMSSRERATSGRPGEVAEGALQEFGSSVVTTKKRLLRAYPAAQRVHCIGLCILSNINSQTTHQTKTPLL